MNTWYMLLAAAAGAGTAAQAVINGRFAVLVGSPLWAAAANFTVGLIAITGILLVGQQRVSVTRVAELPWWMWLGGMFGAAFIAVTATTAPRIGAALSFAAIIVGQLAASVAIDHYGWFGATVHPFSRTRAIGVALLVAGVVLIRRG